MMALILKTRGVHAAAPAGLAVIHPPQLLGISPGSDPGPGCYVVPDSGAHCHASQGTIQ